MSEESPLESQKKLPDWQLLIDEFLQERDPQRLINLAIRIETEDAFGGKVPEARKWLCDYLGQEEARDLPTLCLSSFLRCFLESPSREEIDVAQIYLSEEFPICCTRAAFIVLYGKDLLTSEEISESAQKMKDIYEALGDDIQCAPLVWVVANLEGEDSIDWLCGILQGQSAVAGAEYAFRFGMEHEPKKVAEALLSNLRNKDQGNLYGIAWVVEHLICASGEIEKEGDLKLLVNSIAEFTSSKPEDFDPPFLREKVIEAVRQNAEAVRELLEKIPESWAIETISAVLPEE